MWHAIVREVSSAIGQCELTHLVRQPIDIDLASKQHHHYLKTLELLGCQVHCLPEEPALPDSVFVEDAAIIFDEIAILTRPGAISRRPEIPDIESALRPFRPLEEIKEPGTIDGGDVLCIGKMVYVGLSSRSNRSAIEQLKHHLSPYGYQVVGVEIKDCLHLKSAVSLLTEEHILINPNWVDMNVFTAVKPIEIDPLEPHGANVLSVNQGAIYPANFPRTQEHIEEVLARYGRRLVVVDVSELQKAEGAVTCCSLLLRT